MLSLTTLVVNAFVLAATLVTASPVAVPEAVAHPGFTLPGNLENGVYQVFLDTDGKQVYEFVGNISTDGIEARSPAPPTILPRYERPLPSDTFCGCGYTLNHGDADHAVQGLKNSLGSGKTVPKSSAWFTIWGGVIAFICTSGQDGGEWVTADNVYYTIQINLSNTYCGSYIAGTWSQGHWGAYNPIWDYDIGYMRHYDGMDFCGAAKGSSQHSCW